MSDGAGVATVARWSDDEGRGLLEAEDLPGGCAVRSDAIDPAGARSLTAGTQVAVWWSRKPQDGRAFRADRVLPSAGPRYAPPISDAAMLAAMRSLRTPDVAVLSAEPIGGGLALVRFAAVEHAPRRGEHWDGEHWDGEHWDGEHWDGEHWDGEHWDVELPLPSSSRLKPWLYCTPDDAEDAARMLGVLLDEEVATTAVRSAARTGAGRLVLQPYGFERADRVEHERLVRLAGEGGWWHGETEGGLLNALRDDDGGPSGG